MERMMRVTGKGKISVTPDLIRLNIHLQDTLPTYEEALKQSSQQTETLKQCFVSLGFSSEQLKTLSFHVDTVYENFQAEDKSWQKRLVGYQFLHDLKITFPVDNELLGKVIYSLAHSPVNPEFQLNYTVKDVDKAKNRLIGEAVRDSREKAVVLAEASGVTLGEVMNVDYSWEEAEMVVRPMNRMLSMESVGSAMDGSYAMNITPDDIDVTDTVTVIWAIK